MVITPDDLVTRREKVKWSPRNNILLELGVSLAILGEARTAIAHITTSKGDKAKLPNDLDGLTTLQINEEKEAELEYQLSKWLKRIKDYQGKRNPKADVLIKLIEDKISMIPKSWRDDVNKYIINSFEESLESLHNGVIILPQMEYYSSLYTEMDKADKNTEIKAVATLPSAIWMINPDQKEYIEKNLEAKKRGAEIKRLFVVSENEWSDISDSIKEQADAEIEIRRAAPKFYKELLDLGDMVVFKNITSGFTKGYIAEPGPYTENRIRRGKILLNRSQLITMIESFNKAWKVSTKSLSKELEKKPFGYSPPGLKMKRVKLSSPVITCVEAARAKGIPLEQELKTLILKTSNGLIALHIPGDSEASHRSVKNALEIKDERMANKDELSSIGLEAGTVSAVLSPVWEMPQLISTRVLSFEFVSTNAGNKKEFFRFAPSILMEAEYVMLGEFEKK